MASVLDITQRQQAEEQLREREERFSGLVANIPGAVYRCAGEPIALTLSIADTAITLAREELLDRRAAEVTLRVPASQVAMADSSAFCIKDAPESAKELRVAGFATAAASLRCDDDGLVSMHYASAPLNVRMTCLRNDDQVSSALPVEDR